MIKNKRGPIIIRYYHKMAMVCTDIILKISEYLTNNEKIKLSMTSKSNDKLKYKFMYCDEIHIDKIINLSYFDNFECIRISNRKNKYPKNVKHIYFKAYSRFLPPLVTHLEFFYEFNLPIVIPSTVIHLTFGEYFNHPIKNCIPSSVTHLIFGQEFNQPIIDCIPSSVTHLEFGWDFDQSIKNNIPSSVTHLKFGYEFNKSINNLPSSVTHLTLGTKFNRQIKKMPSSITHLKFGDEFNRSIYNISQSITHIRFGNFFNQSLCGIPTTIIEIKIYKYNINVNKMYKYYGFAASKIIISKIVLIV